MLRRYPRFLIRLRVWLGDILKKRKFKEDLRRFREMSSHKSDRFSILNEDLYPCLDDATDTTEFNRHYVYHTAWAARILARKPPPLHVDISSYIYFSTLVSAFVPVQFYDYRPAEVKLSGLETGFADLMALPFDDRSVKSLSCMHVVEHIGLGRYGDPMDPDGDLKAMKELARVLAPDGNLLFVVPVGQPRIMFNAHRVYSRQQIIQQFSELKLEQFVLISMNQTEGLQVDATDQDVAEEKYGCGCFWFKRQAETG